MSGPLLRTTPSTLKVMELLSEAESSFDKSMIVLHRRGPVATAREASLCYALSRAFQTSLGAAASTDSITLANLLGLFMVFDLCFSTDSLVDVMCSFTLSREMLEAIDMKLVDPRAQRDLRWPSANVVGTSQSNLPDSQSMDLDDVDDIESGIVAGFRYKDYWRSVRSRYSSLEPSVKALSQSSSDLLPSNWSVVSISTTEDKSALLVSRQRASGNPLTFCIPLSRHGRKEEEDEDQQLSFSDAIQELEEIVSASNAQAKAAVDIQGREAKAAWWSERRTLNSRMKELVENIEFCWLGGFKVSNGRVPVKSKLT
jgi:separase